MLSLCQSMYWSIWHPSSFLGKQSVILRLGVDDRIILEVLVTRRIMHVYFRTCIITATCPAILNENRYNRSTTAESTNMSHRFECLSHRITCSTDRTRLRERTCRTNETKLTSSKPRTYLRYTTSSSLDTQHHPLLIYRTGSHDPRQKTREQCIRWARILTHVFSRLCRWSVLLL